MKNRNKQAFTLIELLVVVLIIGILAAVAVPQYQKAVDKARVMELLPLVKNLKVQQEVFYLANGHYAVDCEELGGDIPGEFAYSEEAKSYILTKGSFTLQLKCTNGSDTRVMGNIYTDDGFLVNIEMYFDNYSETGIGETEKGHQGRSFCSAINKDTRSLSVCKSLGKEERNSNVSYWIN
ncbi:MAG: pilin [Elusimicrobiaceae bacterium]|nr:pilin [Elusimicrobiaceae bacterium]